MKTVRISNRSGLMNWAGSILLAIGLATNSAAADHTAQSEEIRVNCYALLFDLLGKQKNVDKLLLIKMESDELESLVNTIADRSSEAAERLEEMSETDPRINLERTLLPPGEMAVREAIAATKKDMLLEPFNSNFEVELLRTQTEALSYAWHLAKVTAEHEPDSARTKYLNTLSEQMKQLHDRTLQLIRARIKS